MTISTKTDIHIPTVTAMRYHTPLRQGGSLPAVVECDDNNLYVMKFVGAGQGPKALIAELVAGEIARALELNVPELVFIELEPELAPSEPDPEIHDLLDASVGLNLGMRFLPEAFEYSALRKNRPDSEYASKIVWFDAYVFNMDRTPRNVNMLIWQDDLWLIDHGAALYFHHNWPGYEKYITSPFDRIQDHVLLPFAENIPAVDAGMREILTDSLLRSITAQIPDAWLANDTFFETPDEYRSAYSNFLIQRRDQSEIFVNEASDAR
ncbi:MAG: aminotransferase class I and II [Candidatus Marinimicrobia bacterium]|nr:aminotransferase class I and II [Candidatus Neomarinimicrobiota bacterium]MCF7827758.1 aminotransferase class I and II [Candidatus Neomarinimicrobiota bacterium]MCF7881442.1 aminotransferase class I and II [Candidatus Neomarinimicrobiota bacterium]